MENETIHQQIRQARSKFAAMACTYFLGVFNDNFFKQSALLLAVSVGQTQMQGYSQAVFTLPFVIFAAPAGWMADRFSKRIVVISAKWVELLAMLFGAAGICLRQWGLIFGMLGLMGIQATFFSPALNGSIPELYPESYVTRANALLRMVVTSAILSGIALAGLALDRPGWAWGCIELGRLTVAGTVILVALVGLLVSYRTPARPAAAPQIRFPWRGPLDTVLKLNECRQDPILAITIAADVFIWFAGSLQILILNPLGLNQFGLSKSMTSWLIAVQLVGIALGGLCFGRLITGRRWFRFLTPAGLAMAGLMIGVSVVPWLPHPAQKAVLFALVGGIGIAGGSFLIPVESAVQIRPAPDQKGTILAASNFVIFAGIMFSALISNWLNANFHPTDCFALIGGFSLVAVLVIHWLYRHSPAGR